MHEASPEDKLFYFERNFFTLDGLWMIEAEKHTDFETALKIDLAVWNKFMPIVFRRLKRYLRITSNTLSDLVTLLTFRWRAEGWKFTIPVQSEKMSEIHIKTCPYLQAMKRNPERADKMTAICSRMCKPFYAKIVEDFNPALTLHRTKFQGLGDPICDFMISAGVGEKKESD